MRVNGIGGGTLVVDTCGDFKNLTGVYYHPDAIANKLCFYDLTQQFKVEYLSKPANCYRIAGVTEGEPMIFRQVRKLYVCNVSKMSRPETALV